MQEIPNELSYMAEVFKQKVARGEAKWVSSGFVGKGFTFEADEMNEGQKAASLQRRAYEIEQGIRDEREEVEEFDEEDENEPAATVVPAPSSEAAAAKPLPSLRLPEGLPVPTPAGPVDTQAALARARLLAAQMVSKGIATEVGGIDHFAEEIEINDYPAAARKKVTHRTFLDDIGERTGVNVISRGVFIDPSKPPKLGERRLYLLLEGTSEMQVKQAKLEIMRQLDEETLKLGSGISAGRYSVV